MFEVLTDTKRAARKPHKFVWCGQWIEKGEKYHYYTAVFDGEFQSTHMHEECFDQMQEEASHWEPDVLEFAPYLNERPEKEESNADDR